MNDTPKSLVEDNTATRGGGMQEEKEDVDGREKKKTRLVGTHTVSKLQTFMLSIGRILQGHI